MPQRLWLCRGSVVLRDSLSCVLHNTATQARQQPHLNNLETHRSVTFKCCSATRMRKFWCGSCSCRVPVVFLWCLAALSVAWTTHTASLFDGAGAPWVFTVTHQRDASSWRGDGDIRAPTLCGWWCHSRHVVMVEGSARCDSLTTMTHDDDDTTNHKGLAL